MSLFSAGNSANDNDVAAGGDDDRNSVVSNSTATGSTHSANSSNDADAAAVSEMSPLVANPAADTRNNSQAMTAAGLQKPSKAKGSSASLASSYTELHGEFEDILCESQRKAARRFCCKVDKWIIVLLCAVSASYLLYLLGNVVFHPGHGSAGPSQPAVQPDDNENGSAAAAAFPPFSTKHPAKDLGLRDYVRDDRTSPSPSLQKLQTVVSDSGDVKFRALPTNAWYQNMLLTHDEEPSAIHRAYSTPYTLDAVGQIPGLRIHRTYIDGNQDVVQAAFNDLFGVTMGALNITTEKGIRNAIQARMTKRYTINYINDLGLTLNWEDHGMSSPIVRGMPYGTMQYDKSKLASKHSFPTVQARMSLLSPAVADSSTEIDCGSDAQPFRVERDIKMPFLESDVTWMMFLSEPAMVRCQASSTETVFQVVALLDDDSTAENTSNTPTKPFVVRMAASNTCTAGSNSYGCKSGPRSDFEDLLRKHANVYPGSNAHASYSFGNPEGTATINLNWDPQFMSDPKGEVEQYRDEDQMLMYTMAHHRDSIIRPFVDKRNMELCRPTMLGPVCLVAGNTWQLLEILPNLSFRAPRRPLTTAIQAIGNALVDDLDYELPEFFQRGAGDTYFSGKMLAKLARILLIAEELREICRPDHHLRVDDEYVAPCKNTTVPSTEAFEAALDHLRKSTQVWIDGTGETQFMYDSRWGGVASCGCLFNGKTCSNSMSGSCPGFSDQGLNFGNAFYNDQHFHYGYHIYAAATVAHFDPAWGRKHWEQVLLLVRSIANPSTEDSLFPLHRHKDWYQGNSWASGIPLPPFLNGKNQESSSEAIAAYEAVSLFGQTMIEAWNGHDSEKQKTAINMMNVGKLLTSTELRSTQRYWHVHKQTDEDFDPTLQIYPRRYRHSVVGIVWSTMVQFGTWFGNAAYLPYGIQLLPLTPVSEYRDNLEWVNEMYPTFSTACNTDFTCTLNGWSFLEIAALATIGHHYNALQSIQELPEVAYKSAGGNGHSKSNMLWYVATRPLVPNPIDMTKYDLRGKDDKMPAPSYRLRNCYRPEVCTEEVLDNLAGEYTCRERIDWIINSMKKSEWEACSAIGGTEFPYECGACDPNREDGGTHRPDGGKAGSGAGNNDDDDEVVDNGGGDSKNCPPCSQEQCDSDLNRCPAFENVFVCTAGPSTGGCSGQPWGLEEGICDDCCDMTRCYRKKDEEAQKVEVDIGDIGNCPPCEKSICYGTLNKCPVHDAPFLCMDGVNKGGCSHTPWEVTPDVEDSMCSQCCEVKIDC